MKIFVNEQIRLSEFRHSDECALVEHLNDRDIYDRTLRIPSPYTEPTPMPTNGWLWLPVSSRYKGVLSH